MVKLIAIDMDGTLLNNDKHVDYEQKKALENAISEGICVVLSTGRPLFGTLPLYNELALGEANKYIIVNNGCSTHETKNYSLIDYWKLSKEEILELYSLSRKYKLDFTLFNEDKFFFVGENGEKPNKYTTYDSTLVYTPITTISIEEAVSGKYNMFKSMFLETIENLDEFEENLPNDIRKKYNFPRSQPYILEAMPLEAHKGSALKKLAERLGINQSEVMAIGDGNNDVEMLEYASISVAMGNSTKLARKAAKYETDTNINNGVAKAIYKYALNK
ncbi:MAG: HAD family phosphatase [Leptotrichiaceae bacterium]|nr:HAD family phosphatase [Leptotrichiaceae bacterium]MBP6280762.1 HAD family phosphatase [Leptotrichiaceae bacterium]MBP7100825.1 HAD family phosphatase [Leptotrichiaceae bacterium]MBP7739437.1 HAD family phosphatase [Leptotrichiaceae bacterium]MBP9629281.1 HAD family phosphatase [Leptotrichiaceae bacterium]